MTIKNNDPFGFNKAINFNALDNPKVLDEVAKIFDIEPIIKYKIIKFRKSGTQKVIEKNLSLDKAKRYCNRPDTRGKNWFCGFTKQ
jgi:hypothetical protein